MRSLLALTLLIPLAGCGGARESYTSRAIEEFKRGYGADYYERRKTPTKADVAAVQRRIKAVAPGSKSDLLQGLRILSNQREHEELHFNTFATSNYVADAYKRAFGQPEAANSKEVPNSWSHTCTDGKVTLKGMLKVKDRPEYMMMYPPKPKS